MNVRIETTWKEQLKEEWDRDYFARLTDFVRQRYQTTTVYPPASRIFAAFDACPFDKVKVVILGQDPYHGPHQANGLCSQSTKGSIFRHRLSTYSNRTISILLLLSFCICTVYKYIYSTYTEMSSILSDYFYWNK